jgi:hypothetical protein
VTWGRSPAPAAPGSLFITLITDNSKGPPPRDGVQRLQIHEGDWLLAPGAEPNSTFASYHLRLDMGGSVKPWMAKDGAAEGITALYERLRNDVKTSGVKGEAEYGQSVRNLDVRRR